MTETPQDDKAAADEPASSQESSQEPTGPSRLTAQDLEWVRAYAAESSLGRMSKQLDELIRADSFTRKATEFAGLEKARLKEFSESARKMNDRYAAIIAQSAGTASSAYRRAAAIPDETLSMQRPRDRKLEATSALQGEVSRVNETVGDMATTVGSMAEIAAEAGAGLIRLEATLESTRIALVAGQTAAEKLDRQLVWATVVIAILTVALVGLGVALLLKPGG